MIYLNIIAGIVVICSIPYLIKTRKNRKERLNELKETQREIETKWDIIFGEDGLLEKKLKEEKKSKNSSKGMRVQEHQGELKEYQTNPDKRVHLESMKLKTYVKRSGIISEGKKYVRIISPEPHLRSFLRGEQFLYESENGQITIEVVFSPFLKHGWEKEEPSKDIFANRIYNYNDEEDMVYN